jgi:hypothetical protein
MSQSQSFAVIKYPIYEKGFEAKLSGTSRLSVIFGLNWLHPSWRAGWTDAGNEIHLHPELKRIAAQRAQTKKGNK